MKNLLNEEINTHRVEFMGMLGDDKCGAFKIKYNNIFLNIIAADNHGWEHVSISIVNFEGNQIERCPKWHEMKYVKELFFNDDETVIQIHPPVSDNVSINDYVLHLWRNKNQKIEMPPKYMI